MFQFRVHPAAVTIGDGLDLAVHALVASWQKWVPAIVALAVVETLPGLILGDVTTWYTVDHATSRIVWSQAIQDKIGPLVLTFALAAVVSAVCGWIFAGTAIAGLRGRPLTVDWVVRRGLLSIVAGILFVVGVFVAVIAGVIVLTVLAVMTGAVAAIGAIAGVGALVYVGLRLMFFTLAIFDGFGPVAAFEESWRLSERSVVRLFGWGLMAVLIGIGFAVLGGLVGGVLRGLHQSLLAQVASGLITSTASVLALYLLAVLYESQRARASNAPPVAAAPPPGVPPYQPYPGGPYAPGPGWQPDQGGTERYARHVPGLPRTGGLAPGAQDPGWPQQPYPGTPYPGAPYPGWPQAPIQPPQAPPRPESPDAPSGDEGTGNSARS